MDLFARLSSSVLAGREAGLLPQNLPGPEAEHQQDQEAIVSIHVTYSIREAFIRKNWNSLYFNQNCYLKRGNKKSLAR